MMQVAPVMGESDAGSKHPRPGDTARVHAARQAWRDRYGELLAEQLKPWERYSVVRLGGKDFAFADYDLYVRSLGRAWDLGLVPEPAGSMLGVELTDRVSRLAAVDPDPSELSLADLASSRRFRRSRRPPGS